MRKNTYDQMRTDINRISISTIKELETEIKNYLDKCGLFYKVLARIKTENSIIEKLENREKKGIKNYKLQDLVGIRIVLYFKNDIQLCEKLIQQHFEVLNKSRDFDEPEKFRAQRINYVCRLPENVISNFESKIWEYPIDKSFEIQIRTIFSEGWHEIEHDFRYKCLEDWSEFDDLSRTLNGILATLENCDWAISSLFEQVSYKHYKNSMWIPMLKNVLGIRIADTDGMDEILSYFDQNRDVAKMFYRIDRQEFLLWLSDIKNSIPLNLKNLVYLVNAHQIKDEYISGLTPIRLLKLIEEEQVPITVDELTGEHDFVHEY